MSSGVAQPTRAKQALSSNTGVKRDINHRS
jgi:hypothetical protein